MAADGFRDAVRHLPDQLRDIAVAAADVDGLPAVDGVSSVVILGTGGARVGGDVIESICQLSASVPVVATGATCPSWVSSDTLVFAVSRSGDDAGVVQAVERAAAAGATVIAVTSGGRLGARARELGLSVVSIDPAVGPVVGLGVSIVPTLVLLERLGLVSGMSRSVSRTAERLRERIDTLFDDRVVHDLAAALPGRVVIVTAAGAMGKHAARRWVQELDRLGGVAAVRRRLPTGEVDVETGVRLSDATARGAVLVMLRHSAEPPGLDGGVALARERFEHVFEIVAEGEGPLAELFDLVVIADAVAAVLVDRGDDED